MSIYKQCDCCNKNWDGRLGYYMTDEGETFCSAECAEMEIGAQFDDEEAMEADEMNWFWTEAEEGDIDETDIERLENALNDVYDFLEVFEGLEGVEEHRKRIEDLLFYKVE